MLLPQHLLEPVLSSAAMREADRFTIEDLGLPGRVLMETAGRGVVDIAARILGSPAGKRVAVLCGRGNNGGDGFVVARVLRERGAIVRAVITGDDDGLSGDAGTNLDLLRELARGDEDLTIVARGTVDGIDVFWPEWIVDAMLGIGVTGALRQPVAGFARWANDSPAPVVAVDLPTGLDADTGAAADGAVKATLTVTMAALKAGHLLADGPALCGRIEVVDIGIPRSAVAEALRQRGSAWLTTDEAVRAALPRRGAQAHKYSAGRVLVIAGSVEFPGAAVMTALAAARAGAGAVTAAVPAGARGLVASHLTEVMTFPVPETEDGYASLKAFGILRERAESADAVVLGPGIGRHDSTQALVRKLVSDIRAPIVIDADGLNALAGHVDILRAGKARSRVLTPHLGELRRLIAEDDFEAGDRLGRTASLAAELRSVLVIKGMPSVVGSPAGETLIASPTSPALATAGTGDVLAGVTASLLAQGADALSAAAMALHLGGRTAQKFAARNNPRSLLATDLIRGLPAALDE
jgi:ADP-dependent NAD(P)H-hydrate dehydratase / NAD(P)H-hydrate epimerase